MTRTRKPAGDLIEAIVQNMRANLEELRYSTIAPSRYTVLLSPAEHARLEGIIPRLQAETIRALDEQLAQLNRRSRLGGPLRRWFGGPPPLEHADVRWHIEFLPDLDGDLQHEQDIIIQSDLVLPTPPELGGGERTRRVRTVHTGAPTAARQDVITTSATGAGASAPLPKATYARLTYTDARGVHHHDVVRDSTTIGRGGTMYPVDVRLTTTDEVSREHARIRRDPATGQFFLIDLSTLGTTIDGQPIPRGFDDRDGGKRENGIESPLPARARIGLAGAVFVEFEVTT
jgi:pSer/pThr/pTyr-binding forkhead associated (FHA) protein